MMWELSQITTSRTNPKIVGTHTFRKFLLARTQVKTGFEFWWWSQNGGFV